MTRSWLLAYGLCFALAGCSFAPGTITPPKENGKGKDAGANEHDGTAHPAEDAGILAEGDGDFRANDDGDAGTDMPGQCKTACSADDCGEYVSDGCGGRLKCQTTCPEGQVCGVLRADKCDYPPPVPCVVKDAAVACAGKCGVVEDGCSGVINCSAENGGLSCSDGQLCQSASCVTVVTSCTPVAESDACSGKCGVVSDGCSDVYLCASGNGGLSCDSGTACDDKAGSATAHTCVAVAAPPPCEPRLPADACQDTCGFVDDGCGDPIDCELSGFGCSGSDTCGGGGEPGVCGSGSACVPQADVDACSGKCGFASDGCGGGYTCDGSNGGVSCDANVGDSCGGGGVTNQCGKPPCVPRTATDACVESDGFKACGKVGDNCGGLIDCGGCAGDQSCGLNSPNVCAPIPTCPQTPVQTACAGKCGTVPDGCGGSYNCNASNGGVTCSGSEYCGATQANTCGSPAMTCTAKTCADLGHSCGLASNGCGKIINCWPSCAESDTSCTASCATDASCLSNADTGAQSCVAGVPTCSGSLCNALPSSCAANAPTQLTGTVRTPGRASGNTYINQLPVPNALVYIPANPGVALPSIYEGVDANDTRSCGRCADERLVADGESVLAAAVTDYKGEFTLEGRIPVGSAFKLVVKVGKWRRVIEVPADVAKACDTRPLALDYTRLAASSTDGLTGTHLPKLAVSTGDVDEMECVFRNIGIAESEFTVPSGTGRIHMYRSNGAMPTGVTCSGTYGRHNTSCAASSNAGCRGEKTGCSWEIPDTNLFGTQDKLNAYDLIVFDCEGAEQRHTTDDETRIQTYVDAGGRMFASHYSYVWIENRDSLKQSADWNGTGTADSGTGYISLPDGPTQRPGANGVKSLLFRDWLDWQGALTGTQPNVLDNPSVPQFTIAYPRDHAGSNVGPATDEWVYRETTAKMVQQLSFNTPYAADEDLLCGRVAYSGFHVANASNSALFFPGVCSDGELSAQEKILAFMLFDLATCVSNGDPPVAPSCVAKTEAQLCPGANDACGYLSDGCGGVVDCGGCDSGFYCDGSTCRPQECTPQTCASLGYNCGQPADGCGGIARNAQGAEGCGTCAGGQQCGLGGPGLCGNSTCTPIAMNTACPTNSCGLVGDGCGGTYSCGSCSNNQVCGGGGANQCGASSCTPFTKASACNGKDCGLVSDGCGGSIDCGSCTSPASCGGGGHANVCGQACTPYTKDQACAGLQCGWVSDGCGSAIQCGSCPNGGVCGGAGPNLCGSSCQPTTCSAAGAQCGAISDGCGGILSCGGCPSGQTCGATGANKCGSGGSCTPRSCQSAGAECGLIGDGCGSVLDCQDCTTPGETCGGAGVANQCGTGSGGCSKLTCSDQKVQCGAASDGCGGLLDCGGCASGYQCERGSCVVVPPVVL